MYLLIKKIFLDKKFDLSEFNDQALAFYAKINFKLTNC